MSNRAGRIVAAVVLAWICGPLPLCAQERAKTVVAIFAGAETHPSNVDFDHAIREALMAGPEVRIDYYSEFLERQNIAGDKGRSLTDYLARKFSGRQIDAVIAVTDASLQFVSANHEQLFPGAPILYAGVSLPPELVNDPKRPLTGVLVGSAYAETLKAALALHPATKHVFAIAKVDRPLQALLERELGAVADVPVTYISAKTVSELLQRVREVPLGSVILYLWHQPDELSNFIFTDTIAQRVAEAAQVPVYGTNDFYIGRGVVGGVVRVTRETGLRIGQMTRQVLAGQRVRDIPVEMARVVPIFDWRQLQRWGISESRLPPGAEIRFRAPTLWESYRPQVIVTAVIVGAQLLLITLLLIQRRDRRRVEETVRAREADLRGSYERIRQLAGQLLHSQEAARAGVARDLHDDICQQLAAVSIGVVRLKRSVGNIQDETIQDAFDELDYQTQVTFDSIRRLSHELHPTSLRLVGLTPALKTHCVDTGERHKVRVSFNAVGDFRGLPDDIGICIYRIAQEALRNGIIHGQARHLSVSIMRSDEHVDLVVVDDGHGFDVSAMRETGEGLGLVSIEERARLVGGRVDFRSVPGRGTTVRVHCPVEAVGVEVAGVS